MLAQYSACACETLHLPALTVAIHWHTEGLCAVMSHATTSKFRLPKDLLELKKNSNCKNFRAALAKWQHSIPNYNCTWRLVCTWTEGFTLSLEARLLEKHWIGIFPTTVYFYRDDYCYVYLLSRTSRWIVSTRTWFKLLMRAIRVGSGWLKCHQVCLELVRRAGSASLAHCQCQYSDDQSLRRQAACLKNWVQLW